MNLTDSDDLTGPNLPCYDGDRLLDLPFSQLKSVSFKEARISFDVMWIPAEVVIASGKALRLRVPACYVGTGIADSPHVRTGQMTAWEHAHGYAQGVGQRDLKVSMENGAVSMVGVLQIRQIDFDVQAGAVATEEEKPKGFWKKLFG